MDVGLAERATGLQDWLRAVVALVITRLELGKCA